VASQKELKSSPSAASLALARLDDVVITMTENTICQIDSPDGRRHMITFLSGKLPLDGSPAPDWLLTGIFGSSESIFDWRLRSLVSPEQHLRAVSTGLERVVSPRRFGLVANMVAGAHGRPFDPRQARLKKERLALEKLNAESDHVHVTPIDRAEGSEPERYRVVFSCRGIASVDAAQNPVYSDHHEVLIICDEFFPSDVPKMRWETDIWHPNIQHIEPKGVCVNKAEWLGGMGLDDLTRLMFEMVQYKNYHADAETQPYPLDLDVAKWVRERAEPAGIVDKRRGIFVDDRPFTRPTVMSGESPSQVPARIKLVKPREPRIKLLSSDKSEASRISPSSRIKIKKQE
jgi:ubiquitin-protein ligase